MRTVAALVAGLLFGAGLALSGILDPVRVLGFLDVAGTWEPSLAFVLGGAVTVSAVGTVLARRMKTPVLAGSFDIPTGRRIDARLVLGSALFGIGWGLAGFCPGPAVAALSLLMPKALAFVAAMLAGMWLYRITMPAEAAASGTDRLSESGL
jgi:uncharacterized membrane protein YedE/YeeE